MLAGMLLGVMRGIIGFIVTAILSGICLVFGIDPKAIVATFITNPPAWLDNPLAKIGAFIIGGILAFVAWKLWPGRGTKVSSDEPTIAAQAELEKQRRLQDKQDQAREGLRGPPSYNMEPLWDALDYLVVQSEWGHKRQWELYSKAPNEYQAKPPHIRRLWTHHLAAQEFREQAKKGHVRCRARNQSDASYHDLPPDFWETSGIDLLAYEGRTPQASDGATEPKDALASNVRKQVGVRVNMDDVKTTWPAASAETMGRWAKLGISME